MSSKSSRSSKSSKSSTCSKSSNFHSFLVLTISAGVGHLFPLLSIYSGRY